jgi:hypothetical protein
MVLAWGFGNIFSASARVRALHPTRYKMTAYRSRVGLRGGFVMEKGSPDQPVRLHIERLVKEEHRLYGQGSLSGDDQSRLKELQVELDQCWDLLRQRRALREFGKDPEKAQVRSKETVETYEQ